MNCPYCNNPLVPQTYSITWTDADCNKCPFTVHFIIDKQTRAIRSSFMYIDGPLVYNGRMIHLDYTYDIVELYDDQPFGTRRLVMEINHIPKDLSPTTAQECWNRLTNLMVFS